MSSSAGSNDILPLSSCVQRYPPTVKWLSPPLLLTTTELLVWPLAITTAIGLTSNGPPAASLGDVRSAFSCAVAAAVRKDRSVAKTRLMLTHEAARDTILGLML